MNIFIETARYKLNLLLLLLLKYVQRTALKYACALQSHMIPQADDVEELYFAPWQSPWRNRLARSAVNRKVGGSSPPGDVVLFSDHQKLIAAQRA